MKILFIEGERKIALALTTRLKAAGYKPSLAYDAEELLRGIQSALGE